VLIGHKDVQIDWQTDGGALERAVAGRRNFTFAYPPEANHVLKHEERPRTELSGATAGERYNAPDAARDPETTSILLDRLETHGAGGTN
jgi:uncharacterized protein